MREITVKITCDICGGKTDTDAESIFMPDSLGTSEDMRVSIRHYVSTDSLIDAALCNVCAEKLLKEAISYLKKGQWKPKYGCEGVV